MKRDFVLGLVVGVIVGIFTIGYISVVVSPPHPSIPKKEWCEAKRLEYCFSWSQISPEYSEDKRPADWNTFASGCKYIDINEPTIEECKKVI